jgi:hypothetical protein
VEYFFIAGNVASLAAFIGFILQVSHAIPDSDTFKYTLWLGIFLLAVFWIFFYLLPSNRVRKAILDRVDFSGSYIDSENIRIEVYEGEFVIPNHFNTVIVPLPPFEELPTVTLFRAAQLEDSRTPNIERVTLDSFDVRADSSKSWGVWRFRARGRQMSRVEPGNAPSRGGRPLT